VSSATLFAALFRVCKCALDIISHTNCCLVLVSNEMLEYFNFHDGYLCCFELAALTYVAEIGTDSGWLTGTFCNSEA